MAQPGEDPDAPADRTRRERIPRKSTVLNFRVDDELSFELDSYAAKAGMTRSQACRMLLGAGLQTPATQMVVREAFARYGQLERNFMGLLASALREQVPQLLEEAAARQGLGPLSEEGE